MAATIGLKGDVVVSSKMLNHLATHPYELMKLQTTGQLPRTYKAQGPLAALLRAIGPHDLTRLMGVTVGESLGYTGSRQFRYGSQALNWVAPPGEQFQAGAAESWRNKRFTEPLYVEDLLECCARAPADFADRYPRLRRPARPVRPVRPATAEPHAPEDFPQP